VSSAVKVQTPNHGTAKEFPNHSNQFADVEKYLHPLDKSPLIMVHDSFDVLLDSVR